MTTLLTEHEMQKSVIAECAIRANQNPLYGRLFAVPNGQYRPGQRMEPGLTPGVPDLMLLASRHGYKGLIIELKVGKNNTKKAQVDWLAWLKAEGYYTCVVRDDPERVMDVVKWYCEDDDQ